MALFNVDIFYTEKFNVKWKSGSVISRDILRVRLYYDEMNKKIRKNKMNEMETKGETKIVE